MNPFCDAFIAVFVNHGIRYEHLPINMFCTSTWQMTMIAIPEVKKLQIILVQQSRWVLKFFAPKYEQNSSLLSHKRGFIVSDVSSEHKKESHSMHVIVTSQFVKFFDVQMTGNHQSMSTAKVKPPTQAATHTHS